SDRRTVTDALADVYGLDLRDDVARIQAPVLVLGTWKGGDDEVLAAAKVDITRPAFLQSFADQFAKLPALHFALSDTARHFIMFADPSCFFAQPNGFLGDPAAAGGMGAFQ